MQFIRKTLNISRVFIITRKTWSTYCILVLRFPSSDFLIFSHLLLSQTGISRCFFFRCCCCWHLLKYNFRWIWSQTFFINRILANYSPNNFQFVSLKVSFWKTLHFSLSIRIKWINCVYHLLRILLLRSWGSWELSLQSRIEIFNVIVVYSVVFPGELWMPSGRKTICGCRGNP